MTERWDADRISSLAVTAGCASQVLWVTLTDITGARPHREPLVYPVLVAHAIWLAPILALWVLRRSPSATILYALSLAAILVSSVPGFLRVIYGHDIVPKQTGGSLAADALGVVSLVVIFFWSLDHLMDLVFLSLRGWEVFRDG